MGADDENIVTKKDFAQACGVSSAAITKALKGALAEALVAKKIDANHTAAKAYALKQAAKAGKVTKLKAGEKAKPTGRAALADKREQKSRLEGYYDKSLLEIVKEHGSQVQFEGWLRSAKLMEEVRDKQTRNFEREGELVPRSLVKQAVIIPYDAAHKALLNDVSKTIAARAHAMAKAGGTVAEVERFVVDTITKTLERATRDVMQALEGAG